MSFSFRSFFRLLRAGDLQRVRHVGGGVAEYLEGVFEIGGLVAIGRGDGADGRDEAALCIENGDGEGADVAAMDLRDGDAVELPP